MRILAIDTALPAVSACVIDRSSDAALALESIPMRRGHAEALVPLLAAIMRGIDGGFASLDRIAVTVGPGSFTGIRVGIAAARAIGLARQIPVVGVSTLAAFAAPLLVQGGRHQIVASVDAQYGRSYVQTFDPAGRTVHPPTLIKTSDAIGLIGLEPCLMTGNGAPLMILEAWAKRIDAQIAGELIVPDIEFVARLGLRADPRTAPPAPLYLKSPDVTLAPSS